MKRALIPLCALLTVCRGFDMVGLEANLPSALNITVAVQEDTTVAVRVFARLDLGTDAESHLTLPRNKVLEIQGTMVQPHFAEWRRSFIYEWNNVRPATIGGRDSLLFGLPAIGAAAVGARQIVPVQRRAGVRELVLIAGQDLRLPILDVDAAQHGLTLQSTHWTLRVQRDCATIELTPVYSVDSSTALSRELRVPWASVRNIGPDGASACVSSQRIYRALNAPYAVQVVVNQAISWRLHVGTP